jgi:hypothetical protein
VAAFLGGRLRNDVVSQPSRYKNMAGHGVAAPRLAPLISLAHPLIYDASLVSTHAIGFVKFATNCELFSTSSLFTLNYERITFYIPLQLCDG